MNTEVAAFLDSLTTGNPPADAVPLLRAVWHGLHGEWEPLTKLPRRIRAPKVHGCMLGCIAWRAILPMPITGIGTLSGTWPKAISARKERPLPRYF
jgi:hypothetical protein